jgi:UDP-glucuronate 4-epimerase
LNELFQFERFSFLEGNLADADFVESVFVKTKPTVVVHLAAQAGVRYSIDNPRATLRATSSDSSTYSKPFGTIRSSTFSMRPAPPSTETASRRRFSIQDRVDKPISLYAATKKSDELFAYTYSHLYDVPATGLRFFTVYGPFGRPDMAYFKFTKAIYEGKPIDVYNNGNMLRDFTYVDDVTACVERMLFSPPKPDETGARNAVYNIGNNKPVRLLDFIHSLERALGKTAELRFLPMQAGDVEKTYADIHETQRDFDFAPKTELTRLAGVCHCIAFIIPKTEKERKVLSADAYELDQEGRGVHKLRWAMQFGIPWWGLYTRFY